MRPWRLFEREPLGEPCAVTSVARSHVGRVRLINEDRAFDCPERGLWAVADGMGGHGGGDLAAQAVVDALRALADRRDAIDTRALLGAIERGNAAIVARNAASGGDAGSTVVAAHLHGGRATIAWVGDSRAYLLRRGAMRQLTHDHSFVQELVDAGLLAAAAAADHPRANIVTRALGVAYGVDIATMTLDLEPGDRLLLCSDGLSRSLADLPPDQPLDQWADALVSTALDRDGSDNITTICIHPQVL